MRCDNDICDGPAVFSVRAAVQAGESATDLMWHVGWTCVDHLGEMLANDALDTVTTKMWNVEPC